MRNLIFYIILSLVTFSLASCSSVNENVYTAMKTLPANRTIVIYPFENFSQTPYAGVKAASLTRGVLQSKGFRVIDGYSFDGEKVEIKKLKNYDYILTGRVIEWRYKTGIDGEPAVSVYMEMKDKNGNLIWSAAGSKSEWGYNSVSITAQELINKLINNRIQKMKSK